MSKLNLLFFLNAYADAASSNNPSQNHFKWTRNLSGVPVENPIESTLYLAPGESRTIFNGTRALSQDGTTQYSLALAPNKTNDYVLSWVGGTAPAFRTARATGADATTHVTVTQNGPVTTVQSTSGTNLNLAGVSVGDQVVLTSPFNALNQGQWVIIAKSANSFSYVNAAGVAEGVTLGASFATEIQIFSALGVQPEDTIAISGGFSVATQGSYVIKSVTANSVTFYSTAILPLESNIQTQAIVIYQSAKRFIYIEADQVCGITANGNAAGNVEPMIQNNTAIPGLYFKTGLCWSLVVTNNSINPANVFMAAAE